MRYTRHGMSLIEIIVAIAIAGLLAILTMPKFMATQQEITSNNVGKADTTAQQIASAVQAYENTTGQSYNNGVTDTTNNLMDYILFTYGAYFAYKAVYTPANGSGNPTIKYYLYPDGSRLTVTPQLFSYGNLSLAEYSTSPLPKNQWVPQDNSQIQTYWSGTAPVEYYCGDDPNANNCLYLDLNGAKLPNTIGHFGDIVPLHIDQVTEKVETLYQWEEDNYPNNANNCAFVSSYDYYLNSTNVSACP